MGRIFASIRKFLFLEVSKKWFKYSKLQIWMFFSFFMLFWNNLLSVNICIAFCFETIQKDLEIGVCFRSLPLIFNNHERPVGLNKI